jgi:hypothetical protein
LSGDIVGGSVHFAGSNTAAFVTIHAVDDSTCEFTEGFAMLVADGGGGNAEADVSLIDNDIQWKFFDTSGITEVSSWHLTTGHTDNIKLEALTGEGIKISTTWSIYDQTTGLTVGTGTTSTSDLVNLALGASVDLSSASFSIKSSAYDAIGTLGVQSSPPVISGASSIHVITGGSIVYNCVVKDWSNSTTLDGQSISFTQVGANASLSGASTVTGSGGTASVKVTGTATLGTSPSPSFTVAVGTAVKNVTELNGNVSITNLVGNSGASSTNTTISMTLVNDDGLLIAGASVLFSPDFACFVSNDPFSVTSDTNGIVSFDETFNLAGNHSVPWSTSGSSGNISVIVGP